MSGTLLDHDFGSESEDDNFNPAPADESDNEGEVDAIATTKAVTNGTQRQGPASEEEEGSGRSPAGVANGEEDDHGDEELNGGEAGDDNEDEDEDEEEDEDDEEIIV